MSDDKKTNALVNFGDLSGLSKPAEKLIERVSQAVGATLQPWHIRRVAKAEEFAAITKAEGTAEAKKITALAKFDLESELEERAMRRLIAQEARRQENIESIVDKAINSINSEAKPELIDDDWMEFFLDRSKLIGNEEMQRVWGRLLAGEANKPGTFFRRTLEIVSSMSKADAEIFVNLGHFIDKEFIDGTAFVFKPDSEICKKYGLNSLNLGLLESFGLVRILDVNEWEWTINMPDPGPAKISVRLFGRDLEIENPNSSEIKIGMGRIMLTPHAKQLLNIAEDRAPADGLVDSIIDRLKSKQYTVVEH